MTQTLAPLETERQPGENRDAAAARAVAEQVTAYASEANRYHKDPTDLLVRSLVLKSKTGAKTP